LARIFAFLAAWRETRYSLARRRKERIEKDEQSSALGRLPHLTGKTVRHAF
jgi:hypothetical protein